MQKFLIASGKKRKGESNRSNGAVLLKLVVFSFSEDSKDDQKAAKADEKSAKKVCLRDNPVQPSRDRQRSKQIRKRKNRQSRPRFLLLGSLLHLWLRLRPPATRARTLAAQSQWTFLTMTILNRRRHRESHRIPILPANPLLLLIPLQLLQRTLRLQMPPIRPTKLL
jgi:hypothetical protein